MRFIVELGVLLIAYSRAVSVTFTVEATTVCLAQRTMANIYPVFRLILVESIPWHLKYPKHSPMFPTIFSTWMDLINSAQKSIDIASFYWELRASGPVLGGPGPASEGERVFKELAKAGLQRKIKIRVAQSEPDSRRFPDNDTAQLVKIGGYKYCVTPKRNPIKAVWWWWLTEAMRNSDSFMQLLKRKSWLCWSWILLGTGNDFACPEILLDDNF